MGGGGGGGGGHLKRHFVWIIIHKAFNKAFIGTIYRHFFM